MHRHTHTHSETQNRTDKRGRTCSMHVSRERLTKDTLLLSLSDTHTHTHKITTIRISAAKVLQSAGGV